MYYHLNQTRALKHCGYQSAPVSHKGRFLPWELSCAGSMAPVSMAGWPGASDVVLLTGVYLRSVHILCVYMICSRVVVVETPERICMCVLLVHFWFVPKTFKDGGW